MMDKENKEKLEMEEHVLVPKRAHRTGEQISPGACRCTRGRRDKLTQKTAESGLERG